MTDTIIQLKELTKKFGSKYAVRNLSFDVKKGDLFGFLGPNGAGKSTTLYILLGLVYPTSGEARIFSKPPKNLDQVRSGIGCMIESPAFYPHLSAKKNLEVSARLLGDSAMKMIPKALEQTGLSEAGGVKVRHFSSGMKQRLGLARALLGSPDLLILDEPTNGLDPEGTETTWSLLEEFTRRNGKTVLISSHLLYEIEEHCNRVCVIREGESVALGEVKSLLLFKQRPVEVICADDESMEKLRALLSRETWLEAISEPTPGRRIQLVGGERSPAEINRVLIQNDIRLEQFMPMRKSLKDFFISLVSSPK